MTGFMRWRNGQFQIRPIDQPSYQSYKAYPQYIKKDDAIQTPGFSTMQFLLKAGWKYSTKITPTQTNTNIIQFLDPVDRDDWFLKTFGQAYKAIVPLPECLPIDYTWIHNDCTYRYYETINKMELFEYVLNR